MDKLFYLVVWKGFGPEERSWKLVKNINAPALMKQFYLLHRHKKRGHKGRYCCWRSSLFPCSDLGLWLHFLSYKLVPCFGIYYSQLLLMVTTLRVATWGFPTMESLYQIQNTFDISLGFIFFFLMSIIKGILEVHTPFLNLLARIALALLPF